MNILTTNKKEILIRRYGLNNHEEQTQKVIAKEIKKRNDSLVDYEKSGREDLINQIKEEINKTSEEGIFNKNKSAHGHYFH